MSFVYLASPYSHAEAEVRNARHVAACKKAAQYANKGIPHFSPIAQSHHVADHMDEAKRMDFDLWMKIDLPLLRMSSELHVLCIEGWRSSRGVAREIEYADALGIPVKLVFMDVEP
jgi:nucleoside 2-deoxyribosyltransferase